MVAPIFKCNSSNNQLIISTGIGDFEFSHSLGRWLTTKNLNVVDFQCLLCISKAFALGHFKVLLIIVKRRN